MKYALTLFVIIICVSGCSSPMQVQINSNSSQDDLNKIVSIETVSGTKIIVDCDSISSISIQQDSLKIAWLISKNYSIPLSEIKSFYSNQFDLSMTAFNALRVSLVSLLAYGVLVKVVFPYEVSKE